jgi:hypothetical protein
MHLSVILIGYELMDSCYYRDWNLNTAWQKLFKLRWPNIIDQIQPTDWQQAYWETHLQKYLHYTALYYVYHLI